MRWLVVLALAGCGTTDDQPTGPEIGNVVNTGPGNIVICTSERDLNCIPTSTPTPVTVPPVVITPVVTPTAQMAKHNLMEDGR
jgi:hypothetical protein